MTNIAYPGQKEGEQRKQTPAFNWRAFISGPILGALPFFLFVAAFLILPIIANTIRAFQDPMGNPTAATMMGAMGPEYQIAFWLSTKLSLISALIGGVFGVVLAWALMSDAAPKWLKGITNSFAVVASQSGGVQLAYAFIALLGNNGLLTAVLSYFIPSFSENFSVTSFTGVVIVYLYFQIPLMAVLMLPAFAGVKNEWNEAASSLGATRFQYVRDVALPVLWPSIVGSLLLLFANSFAAYATAYALAGGSLNLVPILIGFFISGNVMLDPGLAAALVTWMMFVIIIAMGLRFWLTRKSDQWLNT